ncbi:MAG: hypothetical protein B7C24_15510 [Bacteroidetes bacterium 4572_77]|nr:MAG: hypothetical protein B7C24_15510 [Bacteroidetes bacterium 4572_77]
MSETANLKEEVKDAVAKVNAEASEMKTQEPKEKQIDPFTEVTRLLEYGFGDLEMDLDAFGTQIDERVKTIQEDELIKGKITKITKDEVYVDIGFKSHGIIPRSELLNAETYATGEEVDVFVDKMEDRYGRLILSRRRADFMRIWEDIITLHDKSEVTKVKILRRIKGGMVVDLLGIEAFLPGSQIDVRPVRDFDEWVGKNIDVRVVFCRDDSGKISFKIKKKT